MLWDVDYTLLDAGGSGRAVYRSVFRDLFGRDPDGVAPMGGRTERAIIADTLAMAGINDPARHVDAFIAELTRRAPELQATMAARGRAISSGTIPLLSFYRIADSLCCSPISVDRQGMARSS